ncbi:MAG: hypothetical protein ACO2PK_13955 [Armatimonadota bacterium]
MSPAEVAGQKMRGVGQKATSPFTVPLLSLRERPAEQGAVTEG